MKCDRDRVYFTISLAVVYIQLFGGCDNDRRTFVRSLDDDTYKAGIAAVVDLNFISAECIEA